MKTGLQVGLSVKEIDSLTPYELSLVVEAYVKNRKEQLKTNVTQAFWTAYFNAKSKSKEGLKAKDLEDTLYNIENNGKRKEMTAEEMFNIMHKISRRCK